MNMEYTTQKFITTEEDWSFIFIKQFKIGYYKIAFLPVHF